MILVNSFDKDPKETYRAYQRFRRRNENDKAYRCIENLLKRFPDDMELLDEIVALALGHMRAPNLALTLAGASDQAGLLLAGLCSIK